MTGTADITSENQWSDLLAKVDKQISDGNGETTGVVVAVSEQGVVGASVGDSAAWLISEDGFDNLTAAQLHKPLIGSGRAKPASFVRNALGEQVLLLGSDGLVKYSQPLGFARSPVYPIFRLRWARWSIWCACGRGNFRMM